MVDEVLHFRIPCSEDVLAVVAITVLALHNSNNQIERGSARSILCRFRCFCRFDCVSFSGVFVPCILIAIEFVQIKVAAPSIQSTTRAILPDNTRISSLVPRLILIACLVHVCVLCNPESVIADIVEFIGCRLRTVQKRSYACFLVYVVKPALAPCKI